MNLLGGTLEDRLAFDLFGGSGVLAFEAISRGAAHAWIWEILKPGARVIQKISDDLGIGGRVTVLDQDVLRWSRDIPEALSGLWDRAGADRSECQTKPWVVFCCPPYSMWQTHGEELTELLAAWIDAAPASSLFAVELEYHTDLSFLPRSVAWEVRTYAPAQVAISEVGDQAAGNGQ